MKLPKAFTDDSDLGMCFEKKVIMNEQFFFTGGINEISKMIERLLFCMKETNEKYSHDFPFFQLRVRPTRPFEELPEGICFELRWGCRELLKENSNIKHE